MKTGIPHEDIPCPTCREGVMVKRHSKFGEFFGCSRFPKCKSKMTHRQINDEIDPDWEDLQMWSEMLPDYD